MVIQEKYCFEAQALAEEKKRIKFTIGGKKQAQFSSVKLFAFAHSIQSFFINGTIPL